MTACKQVISDIFFYIFRQLKSSYGKWQLSHNQRSMWLTDHILCMNACMHFDHAEEFATKKMLIKSIKNQL